MSICARFFTLGLTVTSVLSGSASCLRGGNDTSPQVGSVARPVGTPQDDQGTVDALAAAGANLVRNKRKNVVEIDFSKPTADGNNDNLAGIKTLPDLERIKLYGADYTDAAVEHLVGLNKLRVLGLVRTNITDAGLETIAKIPTLQSINLSQASFITDVGLAHLAKLPKLRTIALLKTKITDEGVSYLANKQTLAGLDLRDTLITDDCFESLQGLENLISLRCQGSGSRLQDDGMKFLSALTSLKALGIENAQVSDEGLAHIARLTNLEELYLTRAKLSNDGLVHLKGLKKLRILRLRDTKVSDDGMAHLEELPNLKSIDLSETNVGSGGMKSLAKILSLEDVNLWNSIVDDDGVRHLAALTRLKRLNLDNLFVTDSAMEHVKALQNLEWIHLGKTQVSDDGLRQLDQLKNLQTVIVTFCKSVTDQGVQALKDAIPGVNVQH